MNVVSRTADQLSQSPTVATNDDMYDAFRTGYNLGYAKGEAASSSSSSPSSEPSPSSGPSSSSYWMVAPSPSPSRTSSSSWLPPSSPFPSPLSPVPDDPSWQDGDDSVRRIQGKCASFCDNDGGGGRDRTVGNHGPACVSRYDLVLQQVVTRTEDGSSQDGIIFGALSVPYLHGVYPSWDARTVEDRGFVQLSVGDGTVEDIDLCLTPEQARTIAAHLYQLAAELESSGRDGDR